MPATRGGQRHYLFLPYVVFTVHPFRVMRPFYHDSRIKSRIGNISVLVSLKGLYMTVSSGVFFLFIIFQCRYLHLYLYTY
jgi:hypothetical protein